MTREQINELAKAEDALTALYWDIRDTAEGKRLDTILGKLYNLRCSAEDKHRKKGASDDR